MKSDNKEDKLAKMEKDLAVTKQTAKALELTPDADEDYVIARDTLRGLITSSNEALTSLMGLANDTEHPRAFEALAVLLKTAGDLAKQLIGLQKTRHELDDLNNPNRLALPTGGTGTTTNNTIFVGSTPELQKLIQGAGKKIIDIASTDPEDEYQHD
jgi:hypothetical protein